jgi:micrococcal nuclease
MHFGAVVGAPHTPESSTAAQRIKLVSPLRRRKLVGISGYLILLLLLASALHQQFAKKSGDWARFDHQTVAITHVVDGDTIQIRAADGLETTVRLVGVDAPEMDDPATGRPSHWAERAKAYMTARASGRNVTLRLEPVQTRDRYKRLLAYVYLSDGDCLNLDLVRDGQAYADRRFKHSYLPQYTQAENEARRKQRGLWKDVTEDQMPPWRRAWLHSRE